MNRKAVGGIAQGKAGNTLDLVLSVFSLGVMLFSADLGGTLVYNHGVGLAMGTKGKKTN